MLYVRWNGWEDEEKAGNVGSKHTRAWTVNVRQDGNCQDAEASSS